MSALHEFAQPFRPYVVKETEGDYDAGEERRPTPGEAAGGVRHVRIPVNIFDCPYLSHGAIRLYGRLQQHMGEDGCFPSYETLAAKMGCSERAVREYRLELEDAGVIVHKRGGGARSNRYQLTPDRLRDMTAESATIRKTAKSAGICAKSAKSAVESRQNLPPMSAKSAEESNLSNQTSLTSSSAPTERGAPRAEPSPEKARTPKQPAPTVEAKPTASINVPRKRANGEAAPKPTKFGAVIDAIRAAGAEPVLNKGRDAKAVADCSETAEQIADAYVRRGEWASKWLQEHPHLWAVCSDMPVYRSWLERGGVNGASNGAAKAGTRGPDAAGRPGGTQGIQGAPGVAAGAAERAEQWQRDARAKLAERRRAMAAEAAGTVSGMSVPGA